MKRDYQNTISLLLECKCLPAISQNELSYLELFRYSIFFILSGV